jgi:hypothetical protein
MVFVKILTKILCLVGKHKPVELTLNAFTWSPAYWEGDMRNARMVSTPLKQRVTRTYCEYCYCQLDEVI